MDRLRTQQAELATGQHCDLAIAGYTDPLLVARYRFMPVEESSEIGKKVRAQTDDDSAKLLLAGMDLLINACEGLYTREPGSKELEPLDLGDGDSESPTYDHRVAKAFGFESDTARETLRQLFKLNDYAIVEHAQRLQRWMSDTSTKTLDALGEA